MVRKLFGVILLSAVHGGVCRGVNILTLKATETSAFRADPGLWTDFLVGSSKILYFPILGLGLYPRHMFPGDLILIPMAVNSLVWGLGIYLIGSVITKLINRQSNRIR